MLFKRETKTLLTDHTLEDAKRSHTFWSGVKKHSEGRLYNEREALALSSSKLEALERRFPELRKLA